LASRSSGPVSHRLGRSCARAWHSKRSLFAVSACSAARAAPASAIEAPRSNPQRRLKKLQRGSRLLCSRAAFSRSSRAARWLRESPVLVGGIFVVRGRAHLPQSIVLFAFRNAIQAATISRWMSACSAQYLSSAFASVSRTDVSCSKALWRAGHRSFEPLRAPRENRDSIRP